MQSTSERLAGICAKAAKLAEEAQHDPVMRERLDALAAAAIDAEEAERRRGRENSWRGKGIPERLWPMLHASEAGTAGGAEPTQAIEAVGPFLSPSQPRTILVLAGGVGVGKTVAAAWGCAFHRGQMVKALDLLRAGMFPDDPGFWPSMHRAPLLAVDDLGSEPLDGKGYGHALVADLFDRRYDAGRKTIVTTNLSSEQFKGRYGDGAGRRLWDRLREVGTWVDLGGGSLRKAAGS